MTTRLSFRVNCRTLRLTSVSVVMKTRFHLMIAELLSDHFQWSQIKICTNLHPKMPRRGSDGESRPLCRATTKSKKYCLTRGWFYHWISCWGLYDRRAWDSTLASNRRVDEPQRRALSVFHGRWHWANLWRCPVSEPSASPSTGNGAL